MIEMVGMYSIVCWLGRKFLWYHIIQGLDWYGKNLLYVELVVMYNAIMEYVG
jgi:hypothetical protein